MLPDNPIFLTDFPSKSITWKQAGELLPTLAGSLQLKYALLTQRDGDLWRTKALAFWMGDQYGPLFQYNLDGAPCESVFGGATQCYSFGIQQQFPNDKDLAALNIESYAGSPIVDQAGNTRGHVCVFDEKPFDKPQEVKRMVERFANLIKAEG